MTDAHWYDIGTADDVPRRGARTLRIDGREIAVFRTADDHVFALENRCPHKGGPLSEGIVHGRKVACPLHNWVIDLEDGEATGADHGCAEAFAVKIEAGRLRLAVPRTRAAAE
ncbi:nitrite reductase small subunit NirD [Siculibacillus lacustris]|uniref:Nitrite reductase small subunit NirD n=1 Tax=Siculibacillus lacustris TaxID=1549641 RepID=A0A4Q9VR07_9HYPH|nr:nitrite reductase small subunit NirD [Siculibacillus lacustris]TBW38280.1 nitrite reductase small subunit NirD [Siculibacillus lacustris]